MEFDLYKDIQKRTNGEIYIGVVGPVRTGTASVSHRENDHDDRTEIYSAGGSRDHTCR